MDGTPWKTGTEMIFALGRGGKTPGACLTHGMVDSAPVRDCAVTLAFALGEINRGRGGVIGIDRASAAAAVLE